ncbi:MAG TPA: fatty acid-binding protein DegV [Eubacteriaceae bacterium]|nr:fatty acid-binding protein DegV [Eubacteriaceae bacterium]
MTNNSELYEYSRIMSQVKLTLWDDLPNFAVYSDQMLKIVTDEISFMQISDEKMITKSMVNNYVKWGMMPKPVKKKYERIHIAYVMIITILKQVLPISKIKDGIHLQIALQGDEKTAYNSFCEAFEESMREVFVPILEKNGPYLLEERKIKYEKLAISAITTALSNKLLTEKIIETKMKNT